jgi:formate hydrogenlyase subunit 4
MTIRTAWLTAIVLTLALLLMLGVVTLAADAIAPATELEQFEKVWCKGASGVLEACAIRVSP